MANYKLLFIIPALLLVFAIAVLASGYLSTGEWFKRSIELKGGNIITVRTEKPVDVTTVENQLVRFGKVSVREIRGISGYGIEIFGVGNETEQVLIGLKNMGIDVSSSSSRTISPALGEAFWSQAQMAVIFAFIFMGIVVFVMFRAVAPSLAVILSAFSDIIETVAFMQIFGIEMSLASLAALLMLIGYSVDTDILQTNKTIRTDKPFSEGYRTSLKTGMTMTGTTLTALAVLYILSISPVISEIASVLLIGLVLDMPNTWIQNSILLKWYTERRAKKLGA